jgi:hypothetical protein
MEVYHNTKVVDKNILLQMLLFCDIVIVKIFCDNVNVRRERRCFPLDT